MVVDDELSIRRVLTAMLTREGYRCDAAASGPEAVRRLEEETYELVVTDMRMPGMDGLELLAWCSKNMPGMPVIIITAHGTVDSAVEALKLGAFDYITKPFEQDELHMVIAKALAREEASHRALHEDEAGRFAIIGRTPSMKQVYTLIEKVADSPTTVLISGESGTGKELVARALHDSSRRRDAPFVQVNCGAIPDNLFESELFGYERGAFTGAVSSKPGRFELADGGTIFLDEVGELPLDLQVKLLRVLQDGTFERVGGLRSLHADVRVVAATNRDLLAEVRNGRFREDLFYRLNVIPIRLPPLRDRTEDIPLLVEHFLRKFNDRLGKQVRGVTPEAMAALMAHRWPGNIRELENLMERSVLLADGDMLGPQDLPGLGTELFDDAVGAEGDIEELGLKDYVRVYTARLERARIQRALEQEGGNVTRASRRLGISRKSLQTKMKEYGLRDPPDPPATGDA
ncbi:MAG: sigma-54-dependent Fis family transcriptional regulator [Deltaproteobacteria bacterium]|nr:MAG: sigma-54-dependent Fis family transcriptional regulator [Deltaproteobacteria bacterium]